MVRVDSPLGLAVFVAVVCLSFILRVLVFYAALVNGKEAVGKKTLSEEKIVLKNDDKRNEKKEMFKGKEVRE